MKRPKWVLFDYGETLAHEEDRSLESGYQAALDLAVDNPRGVTPADAMAVSAEFFPNILHCAREHGVEVRQCSIFHLIFKTLDIQFDVSMENVEEAFWDAMHPAVPMLGMAEFLDFLKAENILTGVISNLCFSGVSLRRRLDRLFPRNDLRFVIATSDYGIRKPAPAIFRLALSKAKVLPEDAWYIGDNAYADVLGATSVGMFPVLYRSGLKCSYRDARAEAVPAVEHLSVIAMEELIEKIRGGTPAPAYPDLKGTEAL